MKIRLALTTILMMCAVLPAAAQGSIGFGPQVGFYKSQDGDNMRAMGGIALRIKSGEWLGVEASVNYRKENYLNGSVSVTSWPVMVTALLYPIPFAYGAIGAGWYNTAIDYNIPASILGGTVTVTSETKQEFGWHFGGGVELPLGSAAKLVGDLRYVFLDYNFKTFPGTNNLNSNFYVISAGILFGL